VHRNKILNTAVNTHLIAGSRTTSHDVPDDLIGAQVNVQALELEDPLAELHQLHRQNLRWERELRDMVIL
jgi:hypothetical protein